VRVKTIARVLGGKRIPAGRKLSADDTGHVYIRVSDMKDHGINTSALLYVPEDIFPSISRYIINKEDIYITVAGTIGKVGKIPPELDGANLTENADRLVFSYLDQDWFIQCLSSPLVKEQITSATTKVGQPKLAIIRIEEILVPLPPIEEQKRIADRVRQLEPYIDKYSSIEEQLDLLNSSFPEQLKKSILQLAVQGKLVTQDPSDEPASTLLERIRAEKERLIAEGKIKRDKNESIIYRRDNSHYEKRGGNETCIDDEISFDLPDSWAWCRLRTICHDMRYGTAKKSSSSGQVAVLRMGNIQDGEIEYSKLVYSNDQIDNTNLLLQEHDILFNRTNSRELVGKTAIYRGDIPAIFAGYLVLIRPVIIDPEYLNYIMNSQYEWLYCQSVRSDGINQSNVSASKIGEFLIPIPPIEEQKRIVSKLVEVLPLTKEHLPKFSL